MPEKPKQKVEELKNELKEKKQSAISWSTIPMIMRMVQKFKD
jgi:hypothetical protein